MARGGGEAFLRPPRPAEFCPHRGGAAAGKKAAAVLTRASSESQHGPEAVWNSR